MIWALHGNLGSPADWDAVQNCLRGNLFERVNLWAEPALNYGEWAKRFNSVASAMDPHPVLLGYSLGARLAMHASIAPEPVWQAAVYVSGHPGLTDDTARTMRLFKDLDWADRIRGGGAAAFLKEWNAQDVLADNPIAPHQEDTVRVYADRIAEAFEFWSLGRQADLRPGLARCEIPQLWVVGEEDEKFHELAVRAVDAIPSARLHVISGCGHRVPLQRPQELADCIREFLIDLNLTEV